MVIRCCVVLSKLNCEYPDRAFKDWVMHLIMIESNGLENINTCKRTDCNDSMTVGVRAERQT